MRFPGGARSGSAQPPFWGKKMCRYDGQPVGIPFVKGDFATRNGWCQSHLSVVEHGRNEVGAEVLLALSRKSGRSIEWLLTGEE